VAKTIEIRPLANDDDRSGFSCGQPDLEPLPEPGGSRPGRSPLVRGVWPFGIRGRTVAPRPREATRFGRGAGGGVTKLAQRQARKGESVNRMGCRHVILPILVVTGCASSVSAPPPPPAPDFEDAGDCAATLEEQALPPEACLFIPTESVGDCGESLGWGFDGRRCREVTGCAAEGDHDLFPTATDCALTCAGVGWCDGVLRFPSRNFEQQVVALFACFPSDAEDDIPGLLRRYSGCSEDSFSMQYPGREHLFDFCDSELTRCWSAPFDIQDHHACVTACGSTLVHSSLQPAHLNVGLNR